MNAAKQSEDTKKQHKKFTAGKATCIDCHTGVAHKEPEEPKVAPATPTAATAPVAPAAPAAPAMPAGPAASAPN